MRCHLKNKLKIQVRLGKNFKSYFNVTTKIIRGYIYPYDKIIDNNMFVYILFIFMLK